MRTTIIVRFQKEGIHAYPLAGTDPQLKSVEFLAHPHRHMFHVEAELEVFHDDREIEFIIMKHRLEAWALRDQNMDCKSCEMIARDIAEFLLHTYGDHRYCRVDVFEDGENGARVII